ncbi:flagellar biosynthesis protein FliO [Hoeflea marina]|uniref:Flagellar biosynthesis protein FliO n=1 Tax=Hoeflea marina TaxID=274592 RepID=A0A317PTD3_9HYPH|nr:flagellar biosynthetic protein FliO [Hoeflea marina]PWW04419.1 flagellar biosynthesis protein FliO [Hoeflea marina]
MFQDMLAGKGESLGMAIGVVALALVALFLVFWFMRSRSASTFIRGGRNRQPRLAVLDAAAVDARRRLVLVRRDDVEHLIMIGGPTDLVIESRIIPGHSNPAQEAQPVPIPVTATMRPAQPQTQRRRPDQIAEPSSRTEDEPVAAAAPAREQRSEPARQPERPPVIAAASEPAVSAPASPVAAPASPVAAPVAARAVAAPSVSSGAQNGPRQSEPVRPQAPTVPPAAPRPAAQSAHSFATTTPFASRATPAWIPQAPKPAAEERGRGEDGVRGTENAPDRAERPDVKQDMKHRPEEQQGDVRETAMEALDAARLRVLPTAAAAPVQAAQAPRQAAEAPAHAPEPARTAEAYEPSIDYTIMEAGGDDFESILEAELSSDLSDLDLGPPRASADKSNDRKAEPTVENAKNRDELQEEMEKLLGDLSIRP